MERKTQTGYLVLADISGYTSFVARREIEHAGMALSYLIATWSRITLPAHAPTDLRFRSVQRVCMKGP